MAFKDESQLKDEGGEGEDNVVTMPEDSKKTRAVIKRNASRWNKEVEGLREQANGIAAEIRGELKGVGININDFHWSRRRALLDEQERQARDANIALCANAMGLPMQRELFDAPK